MPVVGLAPVRLRRVVTVAALLVVLLPVRGLVVLSLLLDQLLARGGTRSGRPDS